MDNIHLRLRWHSHVLGREIPEVADGPTRELTAEYDRELVSTRKMLDSIPADADLSWKASSKSMPLGRLAAHVAETAGAWGVDTLSKDGLKFDMASYKPWLPASKGEILEKFDKRHGTSKAAPRWL